MPENKALLNESTSKFGHASNYIPLDIMVAMANELLGSATDYIGFLHVKNNQLVEYKDPSSYCVDLKKELSKNPQRENYDFVVFDEKETTYGGHFTRINISRKSGDKKYEVTYFDSYGTGKELPGYAKSIEHVLGQESTSKCDSAEIERQAAAMCADCVLASLLKKYYVKEKSTKNTGNQKAVEEYLNIFNDETKSSQEKRAAFLALALKILKEKNVLEDAIRAKLDESASGPLKPAVQIAEKVSLASSEETNVGIKRFLDCIKNLNAGSSKAVNEYQASEAKYRDNGTFERVKFKFIKSADHIKYIEVSETIIVPNASSKKSQLCRDFVGGSWDQQCIISAACAATKYLPKTKSVTLKDIKFPGEVSVDEKSEKLKDNSGEAIALSSQIRTLILAYLNVGLSVTIKLDDNLCKTFSHDQNQSLLRSSNASNAQGIFGGTWTKENLDDSDLSTHPRHPRPK